MESNKGGKIEMLPVVCQGMSGVVAEHHSMRETSGRELRRQACLIEQAPAQYEHRDVENQEKAVICYPCLSAS